MKIRLWFKENYLLIIILIVAITLRFIAVKPGYNQYHGDETAIWGSASQMVKLGTFDPGRYDYPATAILINAFLYKVFFIPLFWIKYYLDNIGQLLDGTVKFPPTIAEVQRIFGIYIIGIREINSLFWSRYITAAFGVGTVFLTYLLSKKMFSKKVGLLAALFLTFNYRNIMNSHITLPDIYNAFFILLALISYWNLYKKPNTKNYLLAGLLAGVAFSIKYQYFAVIPLILIHLKMVFENGFSFKKLFDLKIIMSGVTIILVFLLTNPYFFINLEIVLVKMEEEFRKYGMGTNSLNLFPISYLYHIDYGPVQFLLVITGLIYGIFKKFFKSLFLLSLVIPSYYMFIYYSHGGFYVRNFIPTTPILLMFASLVIWEIIDFVQNKVDKKISTVFLVIIMFATLYIPARNSILSSYGYTLPWGYEALRPWIQENIPKDVIVATHPFDKSNLGISNKTTEFNHTEAYALAEHVDNKASYVVVDLNWASLPFYFWMDYGFDRVRDLWNKPIEILGNTFHGLAAEELFRYQIKTVSKPWQSPDTHFVVVKVPEWPKVDMTKIKNFAFSENQENWKIHGYKNEEDKKRYEYNLAVGKLQKGSLSLVPGGVTYPTVRITSQPIPIKAKYLYKVSGFLKTELKLPSKEREGFLRIDFYSDNPDLEKVGITSSVSSRVYGTTDWVEKIIIDRAPDNAKYLTVSFQSYATSVTKIWMDDINIFESVIPVDDITSQHPYTKDIIDSNYLYPNSHGNL
ncbi:MAG: glycosyl transferase family protein [uncultured bacterium]|nr:MAG: glycosyl transferase family protein [uncultured bacterium]